MGQSPFNEPVREPVVPCFQESGTEVEVPDPVNSRPRRVVVDRDDGRKMTLGQTFIRIRFWCL